MYFHKWSCTETRNPKKENHLCHLAKPISLPLSPRAKQGVYEHLFLVNHSKNPLCLFLVTEPNPSSWGATYHVSFEKGFTMVPKTDSVFPHCTHLECVAAPTHHESTRHPGRGLAEQGSQAGGLAAQRLGSNPAPVKTCTSGAENHSISTTSGRGRRVQDLPLSNSQIGISSVPNYKTSGCNPCAVHPFHVPPAPEH